MHTEKEKWTEEILHSLDGMQQAAAPPFLFTRILTKLEALPVKVSWKTLLAGASAVCLLVLLNGWIILKDSRRQVLPEYTGIQHNLQLY